MDFYTNLISNGTYNNHESYLSQEPELSQVPNTQDQHPVETDLRASSNNTKKTGRSKNFSVQEDLLLISAWLNISYDNITGNDQPLDSYWERVLDYYNEFKNFSSLRTSNSLMHRWSTIQLAVGKFQATYIQIDTRNQSGVTEQDKVCQALEMYKTLSNPPKDFALLHCWNALRYAPKFINLPSNKKAKRTQNASPGSSTPSTPDNIGLNDGIDLATGLVRPIGRKQGKELFRDAKRKEKEAESESMKALLVELKEAHNAARQERREKENEILKMEKERNEREKKKEEREEMLHDERILCIDVTNLDANVASYYRALKASILEKRGIEYII